MNSRTSRFARALRLLAVCVALAVITPVVGLTLVDTIVLVDSYPDGGDVDRVVSRAIAAIAVDEPAVGAALHDGRLTEFLKKDLVPKHPRFLVHRSLLR